MFELEQSGWAEMSQAEAGCLIWLQDLTTTNVHHVELSQKVHLTWDQASKNCEGFTIQNCMAIALEHWSKVRETELTMVKPPRKSGDPSTGETTDETQPKKKHKKNKKPKNS